MQTTIPTIAQYEALMAPPPKRMTSVELFDHQGKCYADGGIAAREELESLRMHIPWDEKLFLVVPPKPQIADKRTLDALIAKLTYGDKNGVNYLDPQYLADEVTTPTGAYLMTEVDDGRAMLNTAPRDARIRLAEAHCSPLTWWEGYCLYLCFGFAILGRHNVDCSGSRYGSRGVPSFYLYVGGPGFGFDGVYSADPEWGSASCGRRIGA
ncbi:MAG: DUF5701 family protein [Candidatus Sungbacteria bacterium]|nr:DUF5701 family protein [Candidatus Sungbacteria bacterium]